MERVFITGCGAFVSGCPDLQSFWKTLALGSSCVKRISAFDASAYPTQIACEIADYEPAAFFSPKEARRSDRYTQFALIAATQALSDAGVGDELMKSGSLCVSEGSSLGPTGWFLDQHTIFLEKGYKRANPLTLAIGFPGAASAKITSALGVRGMSSACTGGSVASIMSLSSAFNALRVGEADLALVIGSEAPIHPAILASFCTVNVMSRRNSEPLTAIRPFDETRDGFVLGEGAGAIVIETDASVRKRGVEPYAELKAIGIASDDYHVTSPDPSGTQISRAMEIALSRAGYLPDMIDHINAHGTATIQNDAVEARAITSTFKNYVSSLPVTSIKGTIGHLLGACGIVELVACALTIKHQEIPPTANFSVLGQDFEVSIVSGKPLKKRVKNILSNNYSFGGKNTSVLISEAK